MLATIRSGPARVSNHVAVHMLRPMSRPANHYDSQSAANLFGQRAAATTEVGGRLTAYLTKSDIRRIVRRPGTVRSDMAAVHGEQRALLRLGESRVHA